MQFGKFHGIALAALGLLLILVQVKIGFSSPQRGKSSEASTGVVERKTTMVPGIIGCGLLLGGLFLFSTRQRRDEPPVENSVK